MKVQQVLPILHKIGTENGTIKMHVPVNVSFKLRNYKRVDQKQTIMLHLSQGATRKRISTHLYVLKKEWLEKSQRASAKHIDINLLLDNIEKRITEIKTEYRLSNKMLTVDDLYAEYQTGFSRYCFIQFCEVQLQEEEHLIAKGTYKRYLAVIRKMKAYKKEWLFSSMTNENLDKYLNHLRKVNQESTVVSNLKAIKKFLALAKRYEIRMPIDLAKIKAKKTKSNPTYLEIEELKKLWNYYFSEFLQESHKLTLANFLFSCFTGLRVSDLLQMKRGENKRVKIICQKTQKPLTINLSEKAILVVKHCEDLFDKKITGEYMNRKMKEISKVCRIKKNLTMHVGRHSFATNYVRMGGNETDLQNILGHSSSEMTKVYVNITYEESARNIYLIDDVF